MSRFCSIPEELIAIAAHKVWKKRLVEGKNGTPERDWIDARQYLEKHPWEVWQWKRTKTLSQRAKKEPEQKTENMDDRGRNIRHDFPRWFKLTIGLVFIFLFLGIPGIVGYRMYWNSPVHPSFALFGAIAFSSVVAFTIVLAFELVTGKDVSFEFAGMKFTGTSGPVTLWVLVFLSIMATFIFAGVKDLVQSDAVPELPTHLIHTKYPR